MTALFAGWIAEVPLVIAVVLDPGLAFGAPG